MRGFVDYNIDYVIKFGGSILGEYEVCKQLLHEIDQLVDQGHRLLLIPGGGPTDNTIEAIDKMAHFHSDTHHHACARAQDQTGLMICDKSMSNNLCACESFEEVNAALNRKKGAVLLPSRTIFSIDPFERTWEITSDAMAAWYCWLVHCKELIILTNVDGIYEPGKIGEVESFIDYVTASDLENMGHTAVDACTAPFLKENHIDAWVLNGREPKRLSEVISKKKSTGTRIVGE